MRSIFIDTRSRPSSFERSDENEAKKKSPSLHPKRRASRKSARVRRCILWPRDAHLLPYSRLSWRMVSCRSRYYDRYPPLHSARSMVSRSVSFDIFKEISRFWMIMWLNITFTLRVYAFSRTADTFCIITQVLWIIYIIFRCTYNFINPNTHIVFLLFFK